MYNRILKRPMFRRGGSSYQAQGTGITSGLDQPRRGLVTHPGGYAGEEDIFTSTELIKQARRKNRLPPDAHNIGFMKGAATAGAFDPNNPRTIGQMIYDASTAKDKYIDPLEAAKKERDLTLDDAMITKTAEEERLAKEIASAEAIANMKNLQKNSKEFNDLQRQVKLRDLVTTIQDLQSKINKETDPTKKADLQKELQLEKILLEELRRENKILTQVSPRAWDSVTKQITTELENAERAKIIAEYEELKIDGKLNSTQKKEMEAKIKTIAIDPRVVQSKVIEFFKQQGSGLTEIKVEEVEKNATGGRVGLQNSYPGTVEQASMSETIDTPQGDMTMTDAVTAEQTPGVPVPKLSFEELRARLPQEISNEVVQLLANSEEALLQFANIRTQQDVDSFNQAYRVDLILPQEA